MFMQGDSLHSLTVYVSSLSHQEPCTAVPMEEAGGKSFENPAYAAEGFERPATNAITTAILVPNGTAMVNTPNILY